MQRTKFLIIPFAELLVAGLVILLPLANSPDLMQGIQTAKLFGFFYGLLALSKRYHEIVQCPKAVELDNELLYKDGKIGSAAVEVIKEEMKKDWKEPSRAHRISTRSFMKQITGQEKWTIIPTRERGYWFFCLQPSPFTTKPIIVGSKTERSLVYEDKTKQVIKTKYN